jgi:hypothetical protein
VLRGIVTHIAVIVLDLNRPVFVLMESTVLEVLSFQIKNAKTNKKIMKKKQRGRCKLKMSKEIIKIK